MEKVIVKVAWCDKNFGGTVALDVKALVIFLLLISISIVYKKIKKRGISAILMLLFSAALGIGAYGFIP